MESKYRVAVIGGGNMGRHHCRHYAFLNHFQLVAVCDTSEVTAKTLADTYHATAYTQVSEMFVNESLDAVSIVVPTSQHAPVALAALAAGCHVLIEKPIADSVDQADHIIDQAKQSDRVVMIGHIERFNPGIIQLLTEIKTGHYGQPRSIHTRRTGPRPTQIKDADVSLDLAVHDIDICNAIMAASPVNVYRHAVSTAGQSLADQGELMLAYSSGTALVQVNWLTATPIRSVSVILERGRLELDLMGQTMKAYQEDRVNEIAIPLHDALKAQLTAFYHCIHHGAPPQVGATQARQILEWIGR